ncbi:MAG: hypothetical protein JO057_25390 [Chloroflexi bacterium]|nr:hypothetical protein [Chloroflexota bacterium]
MELTPRANRDVLLGTHPHPSPTAAVSPTRPIVNTVSLLWRTPLLALILTALIYSTFVVDRLSQHDSNWSYFVTAGDDPAILVDPSQLPTPIYIWPDPGYDGQYYYRLALEPMNRDWDAYGIHLDNAPYRQERIVYPALAWAAALGHPRLVPAAMVLVNLLALCALGWLAGSIAQSSGRNPLWGLAIALYPGLLMALSRDLVEIVEAAFLLGALVGLRRNWAVLATLSLTLALLSRETAGLVVAMLAVTYVFERWRGRPTSFRAYVFLVPGVVTAVWQLFLWHRWHLLPALSGQDKYTQPFSALAQFIGSIGYAAPDLKLLWSIELYLLALMLVLGLILLPGSRARLYEKLAWIGYTVLGLSLSGNIWVDDWSYMRVLIEWYLLGVVVLLGARWRGTGPLVAISSATGALWIGLVSRLT